MSAPKGERTAVARHFERALGSVRFWWSVCITCAAILAWAARHSVTSDGQSYLELASEALHGGPSELLNGLWSPGYPALIGIALLLFRPSPDWEFPLLQCVNFSIFVLTLWAFSVFLRHGLSLALPGDEKRKYAVPFAFATFLFFVLLYIGVQSTTPDLGVAAIVFLGAGMVCRLSLPGAGCRHYVALGVILGSGYYLKAAMFPLGVALLAILFLAPRSSGLHRKKLVLSVLTFLLAAAPLVLPMSRRAGRLSLGDAGRLNYAWHVNGLKLWTGWTGGSHPPRVFMERPVVLEFASPIKGTFPLWYDPSYWYAGATATFDWNQQIAALRVTLPDIGANASRAAAFFAGALVLCVFMIWQKVHPALSWTQWPLLAWPVAAFSMYALVHVESRYLGPFFVLLCLAIYAPLVLRVNGAVAAAVCATVAATVLIPVGCHVAMTGASGLRNVVLSKRPYYEPVAAALGGLGIHPGDRVAIVGDAWDTSWAHYARLRIVAQIPDPDEWWHLSPPELQSVSERLASIGVKAVVAWNRPERSTAANWKEWQISQSQRFGVLLVGPAGY